MGLNSEPSRRKVKGRRMYWRSVRSELFRSAAVWAVCLGSDTVNEWGGGVPWIDQSGYFRESEGASWRNRGLFVWGVCRGTGCPERSVGWERWCRMDSVWDDAENRPVDSWGHKLKKTRRLHLQNWKNGLRGSREWGNWSSLRPDCLDPHLHQNVFEIPGLLPCHVTRSICAAAFLLLAPPTSSCSDFTFW